MTARADAEVIVVGAGPAGAATAWALARSGVDVLLLDRAHFPRDKVCAEYLSPQASRLLHEMGALARVEASGAPQLRGMTVRSPNGAEMTGEFAGAHGFNGFRDRGLAVRRRVLDAILVDCARAAGARVREGVRVTDVVGLDVGGRVTGVRVAPINGEPTRELRASIVVGADGLRSMVARRLGVAQTSRWLRRLAFVAHYRGVRGVGSVGEMHVERDGYVGLADVGQGETNVAVVVPSRRLRAPHPTPERFIDAWIARRPHLAPRFRDAEHASPTRVTGPFGRRARRAWAPGAALVGDAADFLDPFTGEGVYAALRGGELAAPYIYDAVRGTEAPAARRSDVALAAYDRCRRHEFGGKWAVERLVALAIAVPALMNRVARALERRQDMADLFVGVAGDFVPARQVLRPSYLLRLVAG
jgi:geranylgeranyl reductase family protein